MSFIGTNGTRTDLLFLYLNKRLLFSSNIVDRRHLFVVSSIDYYNIYVICNVRKEKAKRNIDYFKLNPFKNIIRVDVISRRKFFSFLN